MNRKVNLVLVVLSLLLSGQLKAQNSKLNVEFNPNIATYSIVEHLVAVQLGWLFYIDGKANIEYLPMADIARTEMSKYDNSEIIQQMLDYIKVTGNQQDLSFHALLRHNTFPAKGYKYSFEGLNVDSTKMKALKKFVEELRVFYVKRNLQKFFSDNNYFIQGALKEVRNNIPPAYIDKMEQYYGEKISAYKYFINPFDVVPYDTVFWHGNGPKIKSRNGWVANMISSAYLPLAKKKSLTDHKEFGFNHPATINTIVTHEFGHSFVNPLLEEYEKKIDESNRLMSDAFISKMDPQGYAQWSTCITEHIVRLGEIRIAQVNGDLKRVESLKKFHIGECSFVLIPDFEKKITAYEKNRNKYKSFKDFIPELLRVLDTIPVEKVRTKLGLPTQNYTVTINLHVPEGIGDVFISGNQSTIGNWDPRKVKLDKISDSTRSITFTTFADLKFKFTKGTWETGIFVDGIEQGKDINPSLNSNTTLNYVITK
jgi:hypothetical protein